MEQVPDPKIFLNTKLVQTVQVTNLIDPRGGNWHILTSAAFLPFLLLMIVFLAFQRPPRTRFADGIG